MSSLFAVVLQDENESSRKEVESLLSQSRQPFLRLSSGVYLVKHPGITDNVRELVNIGEGQISGAVFGITGTHAGYASASWWEWMSKHG